MRKSHKLERHHLKGALGDMINAKFAAIGFNFRQLLSWIRAQFYFLQILWSFILEDILKRKSFA